MTSAHHRRTHLLSSKSSPAAPPFVYLCPSSPSNPWWSSSAWDQDHLRNLMERNPLPFRESSETKRATIWPSWPPSLGSCLSLLRYFQMLSRQVTPNSRLWVIFMSMITDVYWFQWLTVNHIGQIDMNQQSSDWTDFVGRISRNPAESWVFEGALHQNHCCSLPEFFQNCEPKCVYQWIIVTVYHPKSAGQNQTWDKKQVIREDPRSVCSWFLSLNNG